VIHRRRLLIALAATAAATPAIARIHWRVPPEQPDRSKAFIQSMTSGLIADLARREAKAALVFRAGLKREDMPPETAYTHGALWLRRALAPHLAAGDDPADPLDAFVVFGLFTGDGHDAPRSHSVLRIERPIDFMRRSIEDDVSVVVPIPSLQDALVAVAASPTYEAMQLPRYSALANPFRREFQNCDVFLLYVVGAAAWSTSDPEAVRQRLVADAFTPTYVAAPRLLADLAPLIDSRVSMADQGARIETVTYESIARFMLREHLASDAYVFKAPPPQAG
jgi:hypothetical protein